MDEEEPIEQVARRDDRSPAAGAGFSVHMVDHFQGPLPPPDFLERYEGTLPGAAERILRMAERQADHRRQYEDFAIRSDSKRADRGLLLGTLVAMMVLGVAAYALFLGQPLIGAAIGIADIVGIAGVYIHGTRMRRDGNEGEARTSNTPRRTDSSR